MRYLKKNYVSKKVQSSGSETPTKSVMHSQSREDLCKLNRIASQPHIQALSPSTVDKENHHHEQRSSSIPINRKSSSRAIHSPIPSPSDYSFGASIPKSLERPKSKSPLFLIPVATLFIISL
jgi:phosphoinositide-3-kinase regulatory subunit 4